MRDRLAAAWFALDCLIADYPKPYVALMNGICMGGGMGISVHGSHRVVGPSTVMAMPETKIGFFTDIGASWFLPRVSRPDHRGEPGLAVGRWLALGGQRLGGAGGNERWRRQVEREQGCCAEGSALAISQRPTLGNPIRSVRRLAPSEMPKVTGAASPRAGSTSCRCGRP